MLLCLIIYFETKFKNIDEANHNTSLHRNSIKKIHLKLIFSSLLSPFVNKSNHCPFVRRHKMRKQFLLECPFWKHSVFFFQHCTDFCFPTAIKIFWNVHFGNTLSSFFQHCSDFCFPTLETLSLHFSTLHRFLSPNCN